MNDKDWTEVIVKARTLEGGNLLEGKTDEEIREVCNGVGAKWADAVSICGISLSDIANFALKWAVPSSIIHDIRYDIGGTREDKNAADAEFLRNLRSCAGKWTDPRRYFRLWETRKMGHLLRIGGWIAFNWK